MSTLNTENITNGTDSITVEGAVKGSAKAWVNFNGTGTVAIRESYNVSSITDHGTGEYTVNFANAMPDTNYAAFGSATGSATNSGLTDFGDRVITTSSIKIATRNFAASRIDPLEVYVAIFR